MNADIYTLYESDFYRILDFKCRCKDCQTSKPEYSDTFSISFVRKGNFLFNVFRHSLDSYNGCVLVTKPGYERTVTHIHKVPDECTILDFKNDFYDTLIQLYGSTKFFIDNDLHSTLVRTDSDTEFLHSLILQLVKSSSPGKLQIDNLIIEVIDKVLNSVTEYKPDSKIHARLKKHHLATIEMAKKYIVENFTNDISLMEIAEYCHVSPFHFSRIFKAFTSYSPYRFLLSTRLKNAEILMRSTKMPVTVIAFSSGFNSLEYFISAFRQKYKCSPLKYRSAQL
ncbi:MAG: AraC family transcriptional regulator [Bacteroidetes bacterium]|nr:AraC family transcriptional regulator [Bacteroidota bacterium]